MVCVCVVCVDVSVDIVDMCGACVWFCLCCGSRVVCVCMSCVFERERERERERVFY